MNKKQQQQAERQRVIADLASRVIEKAQLLRGGSACLVPSTSEPKKHRVDVDADYRPISCDCRGGRKNCQHKQAVTLFYAPHLTLLLNSKINPVYGFYRGTEKIEARLSQFSKAEKAALLEHQRQQQEEEARRRAYNVVFDPNYLNELLYA